MKKAAALILTLLMLISLAACAGPPASSGGAEIGVSDPEYSSPGPSSPAPTEPAPGGAEPSEPAEVWDGAYMSRDEYVSCILLDLDRMVSSIQGQLDDDAREAVRKARGRGRDAIEAARTLAAVRAAYQTTCDEILRAIPRAEGSYSFSQASGAERTELLGVLESWALATGLCGLTLYENASYVMLHPRITLKTETYIPGCGFGLLEEGTVTEDLPAEPNPAWRRYFHTWVGSDPHTLNALDDQGSQVEELYGYTAAGLFTTVMNDDGTGYLWVPELAKELPQPVNDGDGDGACTVWRFPVRTGEDYLTYATGSGLASRQAFQGRPVALEDYETPFRLLLTQKNGLYRGEELACRPDSIAIAGARAYYEATAEGFRPDLWQDVGIRTYEENGVGYLEVTWASEQTRFSCMVNLSSDLFMPIPQEFLDLVGTEYYLAFRPDAGETPVDNSLSLGPYCLERWDAGERIVFRKNPGYLFADTRYAIPGVHAAILPQADLDPEGAVQAFLDGLLDYAQIPASSIDKYRQDPRTRAIPVSGSFRLNINACDEDAWLALFGPEGAVTQTAPEEAWEAEPALANRHFVQALGCALDRATFADHHNGVPTADYLPSGAMSDPESGLAYDRTEAHRAAAAPLLEGTDGWGYSPELARRYFRLALTEL